jgi:hypothetical protein
MDNILAFLGSGAIPVYAGLIFVVVEYILGKTTWVAAGSTLELILNGIKKVISFFTPKA